MDGIYPSLPSHLSNPAMHTSTYHPSVNASAAHANMVLVRCLFDSAILRFLETLQKNYFTFTPILSTVLAPSLAALISQMKFFCH